MRTRLVELLRRAGGALGLQIGMSRNWQLVRRDYYSPVPDLDALPADVWERRTAMRGIAFDTAAQMDFAERELARYVPELDAPRADPQTGRFFFENRHYEYGDAELAYAMVRRFRPARVIELGSGFSTLVLAEACDANEREGRPCDLDVNDPYPRGVIRGPVPGLKAVLERPAQEVPISEFEALERDDILFVDTTHVVKLGGDVNYLVLEVLPSLRPGVIVHFHDIWLPDEYHRALTEILGMHWTEQYLLQALLAGNRDFEVMFATHAVSTEHGRRFRELVPRYTGANYPSSFWLRRALSGEPNEPNARA
jgi:hypothetical protein